MVPYFLIGNLLCHASNVYIKITNLNPINYIKENIYCPKMHGIYGFYGLYFSYLL